VVADRNPADGGRAKADRFPGVTSERRCRSGPWHGWPTADRYDLADRFVVTNADEGSGSKCA
jgi:hypothetical protein